MSTVTVEKSAQAVIEKNAGVSNNIKDYVDGEIGKIFNVNPETIVVEESFNKRLDYGDVAELANEIKAVNEVKRPLVVRLENGNLMLVEGHRRLKALELLRKRKTPIALVPVIFDKNSTRQDRTIGLIMSNSGKPLTQLEEGLVFSELANDVESPMDQKTIAMKVGRTQGHVSNCLLLASTPKPVQAAIAKGKISSTLVLEMVRDNKSPEKLAEKVASAIEKAESTGAKKATKKNSGAGRMTPSAAKNVTLEIISDAVEAMKSVGTPEFDQAAFALALENLSEYYETLTDKSGGETGESGDKEATETK